MRDDIEEFLIGAGMVLIPVMFVLAILQVIS